MRLMRCGMSSCETCSPDDAVLVLGASDTGLSSRAGPNGCMTIEYTEAEDTRRLMARAGGRDWGDESLDLRLPRSIGAS